MNRESNEASIRLQTPINPDGAALDHSEHVCPYVA